MDVNQLEAASKNSEENVFYKCGACTPSKKGGFPWL